MGKQLTKNLLVGLASTWSHSHPWSILSDKVSPICSLFSNKKQISDDGIWFVSHKLSGLKRSKKYHYVEQMMLYNQPTRVFSHYQPKTRKRDFFNFESTGSKVNLARISVTFAGLEILSTSKDSEAKGFDPLRLPRFVQWKPTKSYFTVLELQAPARFLSVLTCKTEKTEEPEKESQATRREPFHRKSTGRPAQRNPTPVS